MPEQQTKQRAARTKVARKSASTQAGAFVKEEMHKVGKKRGGRSVKSRKQAIAIGLSKARRAGVDLPPPKPGKASEATRHKAERDREEGQQNARNKHNGAGRRKLAKKKSTRSSKQAEPRQTNGGRTSRSGSKR